MRAVMLFDYWQDCIEVIDVADRNYVMAVIQENTKVNMEGGTVEYSGKVDRKTGDVVTTAVYIDTEAGTSVKFEISAKVTAEIIIT
jgi:hypothetical protein